ncbi:MAG: aldehyde ferredoxin oxidoreductase N-terminal domain-containing protein [Candidatus Helarchaeota archaeon]
MKFFGYTGKILKIDLTDNEFQIISLDENDVNEYIGGIGINTKLLADNLNPNIDPLSLDNVIIIGTGPLVGTIVPGASRTVGTTKFPASNAITSVCGSSAFGMNLKLAGYDHIIITGGSENLIYIEISDKKIKLHNASKLQGKDIVETTDYLKSKNGDCSVITNGTAGENLVKFAMASIDKVSTFGRAGLGAIMGSKKLKAIVAKGKSGVKIAKPKQFWELYNKLINRIKNYSHLKEWQKLGQLKTAPLGMLFAAVGWKQKIKQSSNRTYLKKLKKRRIACPSCPIGDKDVLEIKEGKFKGLINYTSSALNDFLLFFLEDISSYEEAVKAFDVIDRTGLDALTMTQYLEFCTDLYRKGVISEKETGIQWKKDFETLMKVCKMVIKREGFGKILADGWKKLSEVYNDYEKDMLIVKGVEQVFDPRIMRLGTMEFEQVVNPKGAHVASGGSPTYFSPGRPLESFKTHFYRMGIPENAMSRLFSPPLPNMGINIGRLTRYSEDWYTVLTSLGICARAQINRFYSLKLATEFYQTVTGLEKNEEDLRKSAERTWNLMKLLNVKVGFDRSQDKFPPAWFKPLLMGNAELKLMDFYAGIEITPEIAEKLIDDYYDERGWDIKRGIPRKEKIEELNLSKYI